MLATIVVEFFLAYNFFVVICEVEGHGRLLEPPGRSSLWRFSEFSHLYPPENYDDNQLFCGGYHRHFIVNGGRCGPCGDPFDDPIPRENESGGKYGRGIITRHYQAGEVMNITVQLTTSHRGYFQFRICHHEDPNTTEIQPCFNQNLLKLKDSSETKYFVEIARDRIDVFNLMMELPPNLRCPNCIVQWHYRTGNTWGKCVNGTYAMGCGDQEVFRACSDISIH